MEEEGRDELAGVHAQGARPVMVVRPGNAALAGFDP